MCALTLFLIPSCYNSAWVQTVTTYSKFLLYFFFFLVFGVKVIAVFMQSKSVSQSFSYIEVCNMFLITFMHDVWNTVLWSIDEVRLVFFTLKVFGHIQDESSQLYMHVNLESSRLVSIFPSFLYHFHLRRKFVLCQADRNRISRKQVPLYGLEGKFERINQHPVMTHKYCYASFISVMCLYGSLIL